MQRQETWRGYYPITSFVLEALLNKRGTAEDAEFNAAERVLFIACDFLAAAARRRLDHYLASGAVETLRMAMEAFVQIGSIRGASIVRLGIADLGQADAAANLKRISQRLEEQILHTEDDMDELVARYAASQLGEDVFRL
jgi:hypothetical protein